MGSCLKYFGSSLQNKKSGEGDLFTSLQQPILGPRPPAQGAPDPRPGLEVAGHQGGAQPGQPGALPVQGQGQESLVGERKTYFFVQRNGAG